MMQAWRLDSEHELRREAVAEPTPVGDQVVVGVSACGVCRTDLQLVRGDLGLRRAPVVPGHQVVGRIGGSGERVGLAWLASACGHCRACLEGLENLCPDAEFRGWTVDGGFAQQALARPAFAFSLPAGVGDLDAAPLLCGGIVGYRALRLSGIQPGGRLGLFGFGSSAHLAIQVAVHWGCEVCVFTRGSRDRARAERLGAAWTGEYDDPPPAPLDAAVTFAPVGSVVIAALRALAPGATVAVNAIHLDRIPEFSYDLLWEERSIRSVANFTRRDATEFLDLAARIPVRAEIEVFEFASLPAALDRLQAGDIRGSAVLEVASSAGA
jgi:propanol-preferring alcohol dehydrogenase